MHTLNQGAKGPSASEDSSALTQSHSISIIIVIGITLATSKLSAVFSSIIDMTRLPIVSFKFQT